MTHVTWPKILMNKFKVYKFAGWTILNPYLGFLGPSPSAFSGEKIQNHPWWRHSWDLEMKIICADRVPVELSYDANFKWHMPILLERCRAEQNICHFSGPSPSALCGKKFQTTGTYTNDATLHSGFFPAKRARWRFRVLDFFPGFTDKG